MTTSASIHIEAADITERPLFTDHNDNQWSIRVVDTIGIAGGVWLTGTVDELDEAHVRLGEHIVTLRQRVHEKEAALARVQGIAHLAGIETEVTA